MEKKNILFLSLAVLLLSFGGCRAEEEDELKTETVEDDLGASREGSRTDYEGGWEGTYHEPPLVHLLRLIYFIHTKLDRS